MSLLLRSVGRGVHEPTQERQAFADGPPLLRGGHREGRHQALAGAILAQRRAVAPGVVGERDPGVATVLGAWRALDDAASLQTVDDARERAVAERKLAAEIRQRHGFARRKQRDDAELRRRQPAPSEA